MKSSQVADFVSTYGVHPKALASIWHDLHTTPLLELRFDDTVQPEHILVVYRWLKSYETEKELRSSYGYGVESIRSWCKNITSKIAGLQKIKVRVIKLLVSINLSFVLTFYLM